MEGLAPYTARRVNERCAKSGSVRAVGSVRLMKFRSVRSLTRTRRVRALPGASSFVLPSRRLHLALRVGASGRRDPGEFGVRSRPPLPARPLWIRNLSVFSSGVSSGTGAYHTTASKRVWSSPSDGETCDACDTVLSKDQLVMEGVTLDLGRRPLQMHVRCFQVWDHERRAA